MRDECHEILMFFHQAVDEKLWAYTSVHGVGVDFLLLGKSENHKMCIYCTCWKGYALSFHLVPHLYIFMSI